MPFVYRETTLAPERTIGNIAYDASAPLDPKRQLDLFLPSAPDFSTVVFVHGGGWTSGDRTLTTGGADVYRNIGGVEVSAGDRLSKTLNQEPANGRRQTNLRPRTANSE